MISFLIGLVGVLVSLIGWFKYKSVLLLLVGTGLLVLETLLEWKELNTNAKRLELIIFIIGCLSILFIDLPFYIGGMLALNFYAALLTVMSLPGYIMQIAMCVVSIVISAYIKISTLFTKEKKQ